MSYATAFLLVLALSQPTDKNAQPRISATGTAYLGCSAWTGKRWSAPTSRSARTQLSESPKGFRAYAEVKAVVSNESCENTTTLYVASADGREYKAVYTITPSTSEGNGIRLIGWSPNGDKLLAQINLWHYESEGFSHAVVVYDASTQVAKEVDPDTALSRHFGPSCEYELFVDNWKTDEVMSITVSKSPEDESYKQRFCVKAPQMFLFNVQKGSLQLTPEEPRKTN